MISSFVCNVLQSPTFITQLAGLLYNAPPSHFLNNTMSDIPSQQRALLLESQQGNFVLGTNKVHKPGPGQLLLKIKATALNPVDWKIQKYGVFVSEFPAIVGTDLSGDVVAVGEGVTKFKVGDKV